MSVLEQRPCGPEKLLYNKREAAQSLSISVRTVETMMAQKKIAFRRIGKKVLFERGTLKEIARRDTILA
jgi:excisionase family DNA binding protein